MDYIRTEPLVHENCFNRTRLNIKDSVSPSADQHTQRTCNSSQRPRESAVCIAKSLSRSLATCYHDKEIKLWYNPRSSVCWLFQRE